MASTWIALSVLALHWGLTPVTAFVAWPTPRYRQKTPVAVLYSSTQQRNPSKVTDDDGPTPEVEDRNWDEIDPDDIPELRELERASDMPPGPIPHQPWRRGETNGCEDPITAEWRREAEGVIYKSVTLVGGKVMDVTWFLTSVLVTLDEDMSGAHNPLKASGPSIEIRHPADPLWIDPNYPTPEEIFIDRPGGDVLYERETPAEAAARKERKRNMYAKPDEDDPDDEPHIPEGDDDLESVPLYMNEESRDEIAYTEAKESKDRYDALPKNPARSDVNTAALSIIAGAILDALEDVEPELQVLSRHELVLSSPGPPHVLDTQKQFDANRGQSVIVETQDPWQSNRVLKGKLLDRNSMDVLINKEGRMVTIPHVFVRCVRVRPSRAELGQEDDLDGLEDLGIDEEDLNVDEEDLGIDEEDVDSDVENLN